jgi:hypothetical protein
VLSCEGGGGGGEGGGGELVCHVLCICPIIYTEFVIEHCDMYMEEEKEEENLSVMSYVCLI